MTRRRDRSGAARRSACVLSSGGLDSAVLLSEMLRAYRTIQPLYLRAGLRWERVEIAHLRSFLETLRSPRLRPLVCLAAPLGDLLPAHWSARGRVPGYGAGDASVYIPGRNIGLLSKAATYCALRGIPVLVSGILDANPFPDGRPRFLRAIERALALGLGTRVRIRTPFRRLSKDRVIRRGRGLALERTFSCIDPRGVRHCGNCAKCAERIAAFATARVRDRTPYAGGSGARAATSGGATRRGVRSIRPRTTRVAPKKTTR